MAATAEDGAAQVFRRGLLDPRDCDVAVMERADGNLALSVGCPEGHPLQFRLHRDAEYEYSCDACDRELEVGAGLWGCRFCDWDICADCHLRLEGSQALAESVAEADVIDLQVSTLDGSTSTLASSPSWRVCEVKVLLAEQLGIPALQQRLVAGTVELQDDQPLSDLPAERTLSLTLLRRSECEVEWLQRVQVNGMLLEDAPPAVAESREIVLAAVRQDGRAVCFVPEPFRDDRQVILAAVQQEGLALGYASEQLRGDQGLVQAAVERRGAALQHASDALRADRAMVLSAVCQDGLALEHAAPELQRDREIVLAAVRNRPEALRYAAVSARCNRDIVLEAIRKDPRALRFASAELQEKFHRFLPSSFRYK